ncbi:MAG: RdgB/HAM1 family non-canonical purine NTP pyrophosphatase [Actinobacteria bacterium]|nr:RdgB/HAM1 family non-canonical purine NTP pyrophosphatase [Actinomycetota bacterium]
MGFPETLAVASRNPGKLREIKRVCADWPVTWVTADEDLPDWPEVEETGETYLDNALLKARAVARGLDLPALADDSGIEVDALGGAPGPRSARYAGEGATDQRNLAMLVLTVAGVPAQGRTAQYRCVAAVAWPDGRELWAEGVCEGTLLSKGRGSRGFGYDPIFVPAGWDRTMAELSDEEKDRISHRGRAFRALGEALARGVVSPFPPRSGMAGGCR